MKRTPALLVLALALLITPLFGLQERVKPKEARDFPDLITAVQKSWEQEDWAACIKDLREAVSLAVDKRMQAILAAMPAAPEGWTKTPQPEQNKFAKNALMGMAAAVGTFTEQKYSQSDGSGFMNVKVTADSPLISMMSMQFKNPALLGPDAELIRYGAHSAVLTNKGGKLELKILIHDKHVIEIGTRGLSEDDLFRIWNQDTVDHVAQALGH